MENETLGLPSPEKKTRKRRTKIEGEIVPSKKSKKLPLKISNFNLVCYGITFLTLWGLVIYGIAILCISEFFSPLIIAV